MASNFMRQHSQNDVGKTTQRVWNPQTDSLPLPNKDSNNILEYWGLRQDSIIHDWMIRLRRISARKNPVKQSIDNELANIEAWSFRSVNVLLESRKNRSIIHWDVNGACSYAVGNIPVADPKKLTKVNGCDCRPDDPSTSGVYRVRCVPKNLNNIIPIPFRTEQGFYVSTHADTSFTMWLHSCEWAAWLLHYNIDIEYGYEAPSIAHPLKEVAHALWRQRGLQPDEPIIKKLLGCMHTAMGPQREKTKLNGPVSEAIWCIHHMPLAWVRGQWLRQLHEIKKAYPSALLCYANIDSIHVSIETKELVAIPATNDRTWGQWSIRHQGKQGLWLSIGKYWIIDNQKIHYQNANSNTPWSTKVRHLIDTEKYPGYRRYYSTCLWHGLVTPSKLVRKEASLVQHILPPIKSVQTFEQVHQLLMRSIRHDRLWKKKLFFILKRDYNEKKKNS